MKKVLLMVLVVLIGTGLGLGAAFLVNKAIPKNNISQLEIEPPGYPFNKLQPNGGDSIPYGHGGMFHNWQQRRGNPNSSRISLDEAVTIAQDMVEKHNSSLAVKEVMEFSDNFYVLVVEKDTGRGAFELLIDPYTGQVSEEPGPNMMWNLKYGHHRMGGSLEENTISIDQAREKAQKVLDDQGQGATIHDEGTSFYGYYTFDTEINGKINGMLSVNGITGQVWIHDWHGSFISEKEISQ